MNPAASGVVKVRSNRADCALRRAGNCHIPERRRQTLDELDGDSVIRSPGGKETRLEIALWTQIGELSLKQLQIVLRQGIRVLQAKSLVRELPTGGAFPGTQARDGSGRQRRCQPVPGLLERPASQVSYTSINRRRLRVSALAFELHSAEFERLNLMPVGQSVAGFFVTSGRQTVEQIDGRVVTPPFRSLQRLSYPIVEPDLIRALAFTSHHASFVLEPFGIEHSALSIPASIGVAYASSGGGACGQNDSP